MERTQVFKTYTSGTHEKECSVYLQVLLEEYYLQVLLFKTHTHPGTPGRGPQCLRHIPISGTPGRVPQCLRHIPISRYSWKRPSVFETHTHLQVLLEEALVLNQLVVLLPTSPADALHQPHLEAVPEPLQLRHDDLLGVVDHLVDRQVTG